ncbi:hypothetical protein MKP08_11885 [Erythrobacter sp. LQ02-29]|nr:hypothetical protein [Erythrobacter sp. LQ02-29]
MGQALAPEHGNCMLVVKPFADDLSGRFDTHGARLVFFEEAMREAELVAVLVAHDAFRKAPRFLSEGNMIYDTRGMWPR